MKHNGKVHPSQKLVTAGEVVEALQKVIHDLTIAYDQRYVLKTPPETPSDP